VNINSYLEDYNSAYNGYSLEELEFQLENINFSLEQYYDVLESNQLSLEDSVGYEKGSVGGRLWDDWLTTRTRLFRGILDLLRSKEAAIRSYRGLLEKERMRLIKDLNGMESNHSASFVSMEKYWLYPDNTYPDSIMRAVLKDLSESKKLLLDSPKLAVTNIAKLGDIVKGANCSTEETLNQTFFKTVEQLKSVEDIIGKNIYGDHKTFLYSTMVFSSLPEKIAKPFSTRAEYLAKRNKLVVLSGDSSEDAIKVIILAVTALFPLGGWVWGAVRNLTTPGFTLSNRDMHTLLDYGINYLDTAMHALNSIRTANEETLQAFLKVNTILAKLSESDKNDPALIKKMRDFVTSYSMNFISFTDRNAMPMIDREIKMAKGIFYLVKRTIGRKA